MKSHGMWQIWFGMTRNHVIKATTYFAQGNNMQNN